MEKFKQLQLSKKRQQNHQVRDDHYIRTKVTLIANIERNIYSYLYCKMSYFCVIYTLQTDTNVIVGQSEIRQGSSGRATKQHAKGTMATYMIVNQPDVKHVILNAANQVISHYNKF